MPIASASCSSAARRISRDRLLDADVDDVVAVVGQDDLDQVLADVVDVALDRREDDLGPSGAGAVLDTALDEAARGGRPRPSSPRPTAGRTAAASHRGRTGRRPRACRRAGAR